MNWTKSPIQNLKEDNRGWLEGKRRKWSKEEEKRIQTIHQQLKNDPDQFYIGATAIVQEWRRKYPDIPHCP